MEVVTVYRVENYLGRGPYQGQPENSPLGKMGEAHWNDDHPGPSADYSRVEGPLTLKQHYGSLYSWGYNVCNERAGLGIRRHEVCALESLGKLAEWFEGYGDVLHDQGYFVSKIEAPISKVRYGVKQLVVADAYAERVEEIDIRNVVA